MASYRALLFMTKERFSELMGIVAIPLTEAELAEGWHFCEEMDGLVANSNDADGDCFCELNKHRSQPPEHLID